MKKLILGFALAGLIVGCKNNDTNQVSDASSAEIPAATCPASGASCDSACETSSSCCTEEKKEESCCGTCEGK